MKLYIFADNLKTWELFYLSPQLDKGSTSQFCRTTRTTLYQFKKPANCNLFPGIQFYFSSHSYATSSLTQSKNNVNFFFFILFIFFYWQRDTTWQNQKMSVRPARTLIILDKCPGWPESSLDVHSFCWFCNVTAQIFKVILTTREVDNKDFFIIWACAWQPALIAQLVECPLRGTGGHGFDPGPQHTKVVKNATSCSSLSTQTYGLELGLATQFQDNVTGCGIMSSVWDMILQWGSTIKVSIELPVATRHCRDMTEKLLKAS